MQYSEEIKQKAANKKKENKKLFAKLSKHKKSQVVDAAFHQAHDEVFACTDCLKCANCCKTVGPMITDHDIARIAKYLKVKPGDFTQEHLITDNEGHYIFKSMPCPLLGEDNYCSVYDVRPKACREYPHTDRKNMQGILDITLKNVEVCPAVYEIVEKIKGMT